MTGHGRDAFLAHRLSYHRDGAFLMSEVPLYGRNGAAELGRVLLCRVPRGRRRRWLPPVQCRRWQGTFNLLVRTDFIIEMVMWTGLAPWEFELPFPGSLTSTFLVGLPTWWSRALSRSKVDRFVPRTQQVKLRKALRLFKDV